MSDSAGRSLDAFYLFGKGNKNLVSPTTFLEIFFSAVAI
jgi:hypothetical protein